MGNAVASGWYAAPMGTQEGRQPQERGSEPSLFFFVKSSIEQTFDPLYGRKLRRFGFVQVAQKLLTFFSFFVQYVKFLKKIKKM